MSFRLHDIQLTYFSEQKTEIVSIDVPLSGEVLLIIVRTSSFVESTKCILNTIQRILFVTPLPQSTIKCEKLDICISFQSKLWTK